VEENQHLLPVEERERVEGLVKDMEVMEDGEQDAEAALVGEESGEEEEDVEMSTLTPEEERALAKEEAARKAKTTPKKGTKAKGKRKVAVVGQTEGMDVDA